MSHALLGALRARISQALDLAARGQDNAAIAQATGLAQAQVAGLLASPAGSSATSLKRSAHAQAQD